MLYYINVNKYIVDLKWVFMSLSLLKVLSFVVKLTGAVRARSQNVFANGKICFIYSHFLNVLAVVKSD